MTDLSCNENVLSSPLITEKQWAFRLLTKLFISNSGVI